MNSRKNGGKGSYVAVSGSLSKGKGSDSQHGYLLGRSDTKNNDPKTSQQNVDVVDVSTDSAHDGEWEVIGKKSRNRSGNSAAKPQGMSTDSHKGWGHQDLPQKQRVSSPGWNGNGPGNNRQAGRGNMTSPPSNRSWEAAYMAPPPKIPAPLEHGWQWAVKSASSNPSDSNTSEGFNTADQIIAEQSDSGTHPGEEFGQDVDNHDLDGISDDDQFLSDEDLVSDDYDSDVSEKSHGTRKKNRWFVKFFEELDQLTNEQLNEPSRQWHCPACRGGPGAIDWYRGLQPLITHAKTKGSKRAMIHREFAKILEEEMRLRGASVGSMGESFGRWKGLRESVSDHEIVWPPMVVIMNTILERDENDKWKGMGNQELLDTFSSYDAIKARHSYGPQGHRGMSVLIFEGSAIGYLEAERLHKHFVDERTDRDAWDNRRKQINSGGQRQLYGYMARKEDLDYFNQHSQGKQKLKYELRSYHEMVVGPMKQMGEDNQLLLWYKNKVGRQQQREKTLEQTVEMISGQLRITSEENRIVRLRSTVQHQENKEQMDFMENFFQNQMAAIHEKIEAKERAFEKLLQEERERAKTSEIDCGSTEERKLRREEIAKFIDSQSKGIEEFEAEREKLVLEHEEKKTALVKKFYEDKVELEKEFDAAMTQLMAKYTPQQPESLTTA